MFANISTKADAEDAEDAEDIASAAEPGRSSLAQVSAVSSSWFSNPLMKGKLRTWVSDVLRFLSFPLSACTRLVAADLLIDRMSESPTCRNICLRRTGG
ncbi:hypothetical protein [Streptosporangium sp. NPDC002721]|uniref:hypothetical protein n=1 Tax=Streptosporangium sp. NPDC002721 TaxID=3366188 RepID=UPI0036B77AF0